MIHELEQAPLSIDILDSEPGGVSFVGKLVDCYKANLLLRTPSRILLRVDTFRCERFDQLEKRSKETPWELYLPRDGVVRFHVVVNHCRLRHTKAIAEHLLSGIRKRHGLSLVAEGQGNAAGEIGIYLRGQDNRFGVSIDSSGENLHKRKWKHQKAYAPIRETIAAAALILAGYTGNEPVLDPMCGSGTFSLEAALIKKRVAPGLKRDFGFTLWPSFMEKSWNHLLRQAETEIVSSEEPSIFASDIHSASIGLLKKSIDKSGLSDVIQVDRMDFFDLRPKEITRQKGIVAINPPYGLRLGDEKSARDLFVRIVRKLKVDFRGWKCVLIGAHPSFRGLVSFRSDAVIFPHGGKKRILIYGNIPG